MKILTEFENAICLVVEDTRTTQFLKNVVLNALPKANVQHCQNIKEAHSWLHQHTSTDIFNSKYFALIDLYLPDGLGLEIMRLLRAKKPQAKIIAVSLNDEDKNLFEAIASGADGYLLKKNDMTLLPTQLLHILNNEPELTAHLAESLIQYFRTPRPDSTVKTALTLRETETLSYLAEGLAVDSIADKIHVSSETVKSYIKVIYQKLQVSYRAGLADVNLRRGTIN